MRNRWWVALALAAVFGCGPRAMEDQRRGPEPVAPEPATGTGPLSDAETQQLRDCVRGLEAAPDVSDDLRVLLLAEACWPECKGLSGVDASQRAVLLAKDCGYRPGSSQPVARFIAERANAWIMAMRTRAGPDHVELVAQLDAALPKVSIPLDAPTDRVPTARHTLPRGDVAIGLWISVTETETRVVERAVVELSVEGARLSGDPDGTAVPLDRLEVEHSKRRVAAEVQEQKDEDLAGTGTKMALEEGKMGKKESTRQSGQYAIKSGALDEARSTGVLGVLRSGHRVTERAPLVVPRADIDIARMRAVLDAFADDGLRLAGERDGQLVVHRAGLVTSSDGAQGLLIVEPDRLRIARPGTKTLDIPNTKSGPDWATAKNHLVDAAVPALVIDGALGVQLLYDAMDALTTGFAYDIAWLASGADIAWVGRPVSDHPNISGGIGAIGHGSGAGAGYGKGKGNARPPSVRIGSASATGDLDKNIIRRYIRRKLPHIRNCYEKQLLVEPKLTGTVIAQFQIDPNGKVAGSTATGMHKTVASCVAGVIGTIQFPKPKGGGYVNVRYPFRFTAGN